MTGPYDYEPPAYWLLDRTKYGGAWGFNTETGPGPAIPTLDGLRKFLPAEHLWPIDAFWSYHAAGQRFQKLDRFNEAMEKTYGKAETLSDFLRKAQAMDYDGERAMFEAYGANKYTATGVIQWMLNNAWPSTYWHLYDYYLQPASGYFGTKKACEPLHVQYSYDDRSVVVVNSRREAVSGLKVSAHVYDFSLKEIFTQDTTIDMDADASKTILTIPEFPGAPAKTVYFVKLGLRDSTDHELSSNFYWVPPQVSALAWEQTPDTAFTPIATFEDLTALNTLPPARLEVSALSADDLDHDSVRVTLRNPGKELAFQIRVAVRRAGSEEEILPVLWDDNYISLLPGETRVIDAKYLERGVLSGGAAVSVEGWNVASAKIPLKKSATKR